MRKLIVSEFMSLDGVIQAPGGKEEDTDAGFGHGGWTIPYWHDDIGATFGAMMRETDAFLLGRRTYITHADDLRRPGTPRGRKRYRNSRGQRRVGRGPTWWSAIRPVQGSDRAYPRLT